MLGATLRHLANRLGYDLKRQVRLTDRKDLDLTEQSILQQVKGYTLTSDERILSVIRATRYIARNRIPGAIVECGVWRGGSMLAAALTLIAEGDTSRELYLFDTFEGMSEPTGHDRDLAGNSAQQLLRTSSKSSEVWCVADLDDVKRTMSLAPYPPAQIHFVKGKVEDTIPHAGVETISLVRLDTDWYESTAHELLHLYPNLQVGGVLIIDDYGHWQGARKATDDYFTTVAPEPILLQAIDYTGRIAVKALPRK